jgi:hypothetical protein
MNSDPQAIPSTDEQAGIVATAVDVEVMPDPSDSDDPKAPLVTADEVNAIAEKRGLQAVSAEALNSSNKLAAYAESIGVTRISRSKYLMGQAHIEKMLAEAERLRGLIMSGSVVNEEGKATLDVDGYAKLVKAESAILKVYIDSATQAINSRRKSPVAVVQPSRRTSQSFLPGSIVGQNVQVTMEVAKPSNPT